MQKTQDALNKFLSTINLSTLSEALKNKDLETAFKEAHSLKGVAGNLLLTPLFNVLVEMVEPLREKKDMDYLPLFNKLEELFNQLKNL